MSALFLSHILKSGFVSKLWHLKWWFHLVKSNNIVNIGLDTKISNAPFMAIFVLWHLKPKVISKIWRCQRTKISHKRNSGNFGVKLREQCRHCVLHCHVVWMIYLTSFSTSDDLLCLILREDGENADILLPLCAQESPCNLLLLKKPTVFKRKTPRAMARKKRRQNSRVWLLQSEMSLLTWGIGKIGLYYQTCELTQMLSTYCITTFFFLGHYIVIQLTIHKGVNDLSWSWSW